MDYWFRIDVQCRGDNFSASALGEQGEWNRGLNIALENLLNKLVQKGIRDTIQPYEPTQEIPPNAQAGDTIRSTPAGTDETQTGPETSQDQFKP